MVLFVRDVVVREDCWGFSLDVKRNRRIPHYVWSCDVPVI